MNSITVCSNDKLNFTIESGYTYTDSYGESWQFETADDFRLWFSEESGGMELDPGVEDFLNDCEETRLKEV